MDDRGRWGDGEVEGEGEEGRVSGGKDGRRKGWKCGRRWGKGDEEGI